MKLAETAIEAYTIDVPESTLNDLKKRLENTRWSPSPNLGWEGQGPTFRTCTRQRTCAIPADSYSWISRFVYRFIKLIPLLTDPAAFGGQAEDAFDVVAPDIPGYGFSDKPDTKGATFAVSDLWARLMTERLGYKRFGAHGGDWGSTITEQLANQHSGAVVAIHLTDVPFGHILRKPDDPSPSEQKLFKKTEEWI